MPLPAGASRYLDHREFSSAEREQLLKLLEFIQEPQDDRLTALEAGGTGYPLQLGHAGI